MIASLTGVLEYRDEQRAVLNVHGVGFVLLMSTHTLAALGELGREVKVLTLMHVRDDNVLLYGFRDSEERILFEKLTSVSGVGPRFALAALSAFSPADLAGIISAGDTNRLTTVSGIGKKTAQRIILELKGSMDLSEAEAGDGAAGAGQIADASAALMQMGFSSAEINVAMKGFDGEKDDTGAMVRYALKRLGQ
jgi:Holliday junction DNA helicase RuvA